MLIILRFQKTRVNICTYYINFPTVSSLISQNLCTPLPPPKPTSVWCMGWENPLWGVSQNRARTENLCLRLGVQVLHFYSKFGLVALLQLVGQFKDILVVILKIQKIWDQTISLLHICALKNKPGQLKYSLIFNKHQTNFSRTCFNRRTL